MYSNRVPILTPMFMHNEMKLRSTLRLFFSEDLIKKNARYILPLDQVKQCQLLYTEHGFETLPDEVIVCPLGQT